MYNEEIKLRYLEESRDRNTALDILGTRMFKQIAYYEEELQKDCCCFTVNEIIIYYQRKCSTSVDSLNTLNSLFKGYTNWCLARNMIEDNQNHYNEINLDILNNCLNYGMVNDKIITRKDLLFLIQNFMNASDKALLLAIFEGICGDNMSELVNLKCEDIKTKNGKHVVKLFSGRKLEISEELYNYCRESQDCYVHYAENTHSIYQKNYNPSDKGVFKIIDAKRVQSINRKSLYNKLVRVKKIMNLNYLTTYTLLESGRIEMIRGIMKETGQSLDEILKSKVTEDRYGALKSWTNWKRKYQEYLEVEGLED